MLFWYPFIPDVSEIPTAASIARAKAERDLERRAFTATTGCEVDEDGTLVGLRIANEISAAVYGPKGENR